MNMKKIFAAMAATAISAGSLAAMSFSANAADTLAKAALMGGFGTESNWDLDKDNPTTAIIDGDAQYECVWTVSEATSTGSNFFITVSMQPVAGVDNFNTATFPNLSVTLDEVWVDGTKLSGYDASAAVDTSYFENGMGSSRIYLRGDWASNSTKIIADDTTIESEIKVRFTVSGTGFEGTSNVTPDVVVGDGTTTTTPAANNGGDNTTTTTTTGKSSNGGTTESSTKTGDAGVGIAVASIAVAGAVAFVARKKD